MTTTYTFKAAFTSYGQPYAPSPAPTCTVVDSANNMLANAQAVTLIGNLVGVCLYSYSGADDLDLVGRFLTTDTNVDQATLYSYTPSQVVNKLDARISSGAAMTQSGLTAQGYTTTRAGYIDVLNGLVAAIWASAARTLTAFGFTVATNSDANVTAIKAKTDNLPSDPADESALEAAITAAAAPLATQISVDAITAKLLTIAGEVWSYAVRTLSNVTSSVTVLFTPSAVSATRFCYCTLNEMAEDQSEWVGNEALRRFILPATQYLVNEIGQFQPLIQLKKLNGNGKTVLFVPPLLQISGSVVNYQTTLSAADYLLRADDESDSPIWSNGPYLRMEAAPDSVNLSTWYERAQSVEIPGVWGLYQRADATGATLGSAQNASVASLSVDDGAKVSPGMLLQIDSEWEFVTDYGAASAATTLGAALDASSEIVALVSGAAVKIGEIIKFDFEQCKVLDIQTNSIYVSRGWNNTKKVAHLVGAAVSVYRTFSVERGVNGSTAQTHENGAALARLVVPEDVNYLTRQIATLMMKKSQTGYAGRAGNAEGETFYNFEFPRDAIARVKANYDIPLAR
jgi:hypothetical protein